MQCGKEKGCLICERDKTIEKFKTRIRQLEAAINKVFAFRISTSFAENVNELTILQNELKRALENGRC
jgi:endonuclease I